MPRELDFLIQFRRAKDVINEIVEMPEQKATLFVKLCLQNNGMLSQVKRRRHFRELTDNEVASMQEAIARSREE